MDYVVAVEGLEDIDLANAPLRVRKMASRAINYAMRRTRTQSARLMREQVNFGARYLTGRENGRLMIATFAKPGDLVGRIRGRDRPTSLAQFTKQKPRVAGGPRRRKKGVDVTVKPGAKVTMERAFLMNLRGGNVGLAVRTNGGPPARAYKPKGIGNNLWLLYGPSVDQVFRSVAEDVSDDAAKLMEREFIRLAGALL